MKFYCEAFIGNDYYHIQQSFGGGCSQRYCWGGKVKNMYNFTKVNYNVTVSAHLTWVSILSSRQSPESICTPLIVMFGINFVRKTG